MTELKVYIVELFRSDYREPITLIETHDEKEAIDVLTGADDEWTLSTAEKRPFRMKKPIRSSFLPSLIYEIKITEYIAEEYEKKNFINKFTNGKPFADTMGSPNFGR